MIVGAFVVGAVFTPPDVVSQLLLAVPLWLLYELGIVVAGMIAARQARAEEGGHALDRADANQHKE